MGNTERILRNSAISNILQIIGFLLQFINRKAFVLFLDIEYLGYQSLFGNIFSILSVAELGIGEIITFHLYKEVVNHNEEEIGRLMELYKWFYRATAVAVLLLGVGFSFFLPFFVKDAKASWDYLRLVYFLLLASTFLGYLLRYRRALYFVTQQEYRCVKIDLYSSVVIQIIELVILALTRNYIAYLAVHLSSDILSNFIIYLRSSRDFPYLKHKYRINAAYIRQRGLRSDVFNILIHKISYAIYSGTDNIIISANRGISTVALYSNYLAVTKAVKTVFITKLISAIQAGIGNVIYDDRDKQELWDQFEMLDVFSFFFAAYIGLGHLIFFQPFITLWMGKEHLLEDSYVFAYVFTIYITLVWEIVYRYRSVFGDYRQDRNGLLISAILNIAISIPGAKYFGVTGVQLGTLAAFLPIGIYRIRFVVKNFFKQSMSKYLLKHLMLFGFFVVECAICWKLTVALPISIGGFITRTCVWMFTPLLMNVAVFFRNPHFKALLNYSRSIIRLIRKKLDKNPKKQ